MARTNEAATPLIGFLVALVVFGSLFTYVVVNAAEDGADGGTPQGGRLDLRASSLADLIVNNPGRAWYPDAACTDAGTAPGQMHADQVGAPSVGRFGLGIELCDIGINGTAGANQLDYAKVINLRGGLRQADGSNGYVDYEEARSSLGLDRANLDFHIRSEPVLASVQQILGTGRKDATLRPLYVGDYVEVGGGGGAIVRQVQHEVGIEDTADGMTPWVHITNNGTTTTAFEVGLTLPLSQGNVIYERHTALLAPGASENVTTEIPDTADWSWGNPGSPSVAYSISDIQGTLASGTIDATGIDQGQGANQHIVTVAADGLEELLSGGTVNVRVHYDAYDGAGKPVKHADWRLRMDPTTGVTPATPVFLPNTKSGFESFEFTAAGSYAAVLESGDGASVFINDTINIVATPMDSFGAGGGGGTYEPAPPVAIEAGYIDRVIEQFENFTFDSSYHHPTVPYQAGGDVYPGIKVVMNNALPAVLIDDKGTPTQSDDEPTMANYNVMVVGSNVDHNAMTSAAAKKTIRDWVYAGGTLIVFGSTEQTVNWLQPIFHASIDSANGGLSVPDENHPVLNVPNRLDYTSYDTHDIVWELNREQDKNHFTHVVTDGDDDYLAVSDPGEFGKGRVILSSYQPFDLMQGQDSPCDPSGAAACPGMQLFHNFVTIAYHGLYMDYGPPLPLDRTHGSVVRVASVHHPDLERRVTMVVRVYVF